MQARFDADTYQRLWYAHGGSGSRKPVKPADALHWKAGQPVHWQEQTTFIRVKHALVRIVSILQMIVGIVYLQYRARKTIGVFTKTSQGIFFAYQIVFFILESLSVFSNIFRVTEVWNIFRRNCVSMEQIPNRLIAPHFVHSPRTRVPPQFCNYPSVGVFIPCYNEDIDLVTDTVVAALQMDYPRQLLTVYLCDDGKDPLKRNMISRLRKRYDNVYYVVRPDHTHAKAGNLNYALERTTTDLVVTLDADFIVRPFLLQRLLPYYFVWNPKIGMYEFNQTLAAVQTPQHFRNLSPYDSDFLDQRGIFFFDLILPGKDWFNASTLVGTTNLINRVALKEANYFPYHSITEDTGLTIIFHGLGYRTYYVNESMATGLATVSMWGNLRQRARWLKGDFQILFSRHGPLTQKGLSIFQRLLYMNMTFSRGMSVVHLGYDLSVLLLLVFGIAPLDARDTMMFLAHLCAYVFMGVVFRTVVNLGGGGLDKSESGNLAFEAMFRYTTFKGLFMALFKGSNIKFKVTEKAHIKGRGMEDDSSQSEDDSHYSEERFASRSANTVLGRPGPDAEAIGVIGGSGGGGNENGGNGGGEGVALPMVRTPAPVVVDVSNSRGHGGNVEGQVSSSTERTSSSEEEDNGRMYKKRIWGKTDEERQAQRRDIRRNLKRVWFNAVMAGMLIFSITWGIIRPPPHVASGERMMIDGEFGHFEYDNLLPLGLALGFGIANLIPHLLAVYLCFVPYVNGWMMEDTVYGRCDQWAVHPTQGNLFVPFSFVSLMTASRVFIVSGTVIITVVMTSLEPSARWVPETVRQAL